MITLFKKPKQDTKQIIEQIHLEFNTFGDNIMNNYTKSRSENNLKFLMLEKNGFTKTEEYQILVNRMRDNDQQRDLYKAIENLSMKYPLHKFISTEQAEKICQKYNLVIGPTTIFKGFVPVKNLKDIEKFRNHLKEDDKYTYTEVISGRRNQFGWIENVEVLSSKKSYDEQEEKDRTDKKIYGYYASYMQIQKNSFIRRDVSELLIAAPIADMNTDDYDKDGSWLKKKKIVYHYPDPVILFPMSYNGIKLYAVVTAWGDEASDEDVVNQKMN
jgi:hypothetical protein